MDEREVLLKAAEQRIDQKIGELESLQSSIEALLVTHDEQSEAQMQSLVKIYESMKPKDAARIFEELDMEVLRSEEHTSELQSLMRISYAVFCLTTPTPPHHPPPP